MRHPFDPELAAALAMAPEVDLSDLAAARAAQAEELAADPAAAEGRGGAEGVEVGEVKVPCRDASRHLLLRTYRPRDVPGPLPVLYGIHGGGYVLGSPEVDHDTNLRFCRELGALVVSVDYRLAPEHPYPAALEDCYAGLCALVERAAELDLRPDRLAVWGDSAGAGLATALTMLARDRGGPAIRFQHLHSPAVDDRLATPSARRFTDTPVWNRRNAEISWDAYLGPGTPGSDGVPPYAAPARARTADLVGLPPAYIAVMEFDPLRDEGIDYARALLAAGVPTELHLFPGTFHGAAMVPHAAVVQRITAEAVAVLRRALGR
ncbi:alpha/beta hydrolase [Peterkaempfera bronchialis]|uniref:Alpha/beta hydrolase n=1 Tax=Peterkaempfera bronchialis TaxID=2126346 RepID=A0A345SU11_9ACTN|nr:alpha/beta hydrolase [Peterkaempfera bronchialis]AXI77216.1 alpha/beta hydrolase [Peterkaempfera bronchialis]